MKCEGSNDGCTWIGTINEYIHHRSHCTLASPPAAPEPVQPDPDDDFIFNQNFDAQETLSGWLCFLFFLGVGIIAGAKLADGQVGLPLLPSTDPSGHLNMDIDDFLAIGTA